MATRIISFAIALAFVFSAVGVLVYLAWQNARQTDEAPKTTEQINEERLTALQGWAFGELPAFTPLTQNVDQVEMQEIYGSNDEQFVIENDIITFKFWYALTQNGQIFYTHEQLPGARPRTAGLAGLLSGIRDLVLDKKVGSTWRVLIPYGQINQYLDLADLQQSTGDATLQLPINYSLVLDVEIVGIADRKLKGFLGQEELSDFTPLPEPLTDLKTEDVIKGTGTTAAVGDTVVVNYIGVLGADGSLFDKNNAATFLLSERGTVEGFFNGVSGMQVGGRRRILIPSSQGYGEQGVTTPQGVAVVPSGADLVFDVELLTVYKAPQAPSEGSQGAGDATGETPDAAQKEEEVRGE